LRTGFTTVRPARKGLSKEKRGWREDTSREKRFFLYSLKKKELGGPLPERAGEKDHRRTREKSLFGIGWDCYGRSFQPVKGNLVKRWSGGKIS